MSLGYVCPDCECTRQQAKGELVPVGSDVARMAHCDAQHLGSIGDPRVQPANDFQDTNSETASVLENQRAHVGARASQTIPPSARRTVLVRDQRRCQVPGCRNTRFLDRDPAGALRVQHAEGSEYGQRLEPRALDTFAKVFSALRHLGFREGQIRGAFQRLHGNSSLREASFDQLLREGLAQLRAPAGPGNGG